jgi:hypothetical protein
MNICLAVPLSLLEPPPIRFHERLGDAIELAGALLLDSFFNELTRNETGTSARRECRKCSNLALLLLLLKVLS